MNIEHHPREETLASYAAGALPAALALVVGCHLEQCAACRADVADAESLGGLLIGQLPPRPLSAAAREAVLRELDRPGEPPAARPAPSPAARNAAIPRLLQPLLDADSYDALPWRRIGPGIRQLRLPCEEGVSVMLRVDAGRSMPLHTHRSSELTLILQGGYHDKLGSFHVGDLADLDGDTEHQPVAFDDEGCICLAGLDDKLRFRGIIPRLLQPFTGI